MSWEEHEARALEDEFYHLERESESALSSGATAQVRSRITAEDDDYTSRWLIRDAILRGDAKHAGHMAQMLVSRVLRRNPGSLAS